MSKKFYERGIILSQQFSWIDFWVHKRNNIVTWNFMDISKIIEVQKEFKKNCKATVDKVKRNS